MNLPPLRGTPKQVKWATTIRDNTFMDRDSYGMVVLETAEKVDDATWWIANNTSSHKLVTVPKDPAPHQLVGGPPPPPKGRAPSAEYIDAMTPLNTMPRLATHTGEYTGVKQRELPRAGEDGDENDATREPHDAELFAESASHNPAVARVAITGLMAKAYLRSSQKEVGQALLHRARCQFDGLREQLIAAIDKDLAGLERILK